MISRIHTKKKKKKIQILETDKYRIVMQFNNEVR